MRGHSCFSVFSLTITVRLGDTFMFLCQININESLGDQHENLIRVSDQQDVEQCRTTQERASFFGACTRNGFDIMIPITNSLSLANRERFEAGQVYYFTSKCNALVTLVAIVVCRFL